MQSKIIYRKINWWRKSLPWISQQVIATYRRKNSTSPYQELVYKAKKIDWDTITFPKEYDYLTKPGKDGA